MSKHKKPIEQPRPEATHNAVVDVWELSMALREAAMANPVKVFPPGISDEAPTADSEPDSAETGTKPSSDTHHTRSAS